MVWLLRRTTSVQFFCIVKFHIRYAVQSEQVSCTMYVVSSVPVT